MRRRKAEEKQELGSDPAVAISNENVKNKICTVPSLFKRTCQFILLLYILIPVSLFLVPQISEQLVFMNLNLGKNEVKSLSMPTREYGLRGTGTFYINCDNVKLGIWHILPKNRIELYKDDDFPSEESLSEALRDAGEVIIYLHGSTMSRATGEGAHRADLYRVLQDRYFHTVAFDYRGFGDSSGWPTEIGMARDFQCVVEWINKRTSSNAKIIAWGHSLGTAVLSLSMRQLWNNCDSNPDACLKIDGLIFEGGFTNIIQGAKDSYPAYLFNLVYPSSLLEVILNHTLSARNIYMTTDEHVMEIRDPVLLLHAEDDDIIPFQHGIELHERIKRSKHTVKHKFVKFRGHHKYSHNYMYKCEQLYSIIRDFMSGADSEESNDDVIVV